MKPLFDVSYYPFYGANKCPMCKRGNIQVHEHYVKCFACSTVGPMGDSPEEAIERWNLATED